MKNVKRKIISKYKVIDLQRPSVITFTRLDRDDHEIVERRSTY